MTSDEKLSALKEASRIRTFMVSECKLMASLRDLEPEGSELRHRYRTMLDGMLHLTQKVIDL